MKPSLKCRFHIMSVCSYMILFGFLFPLKNVYAGNPTLMNKLYVNQSVAVSGNGTSWSTAIKELRDALDLAQTDLTITEVWVAAGIYTPTSTLDPLISFKMRNNLTIYGGFDGTESTLSQRDYNNNTTILSGDLLGNDDYSTIPGTGISENTYHVIFNYYNFLDNTAILDGLHIVGGNSSSNPPHHVGGGLYNKQSSPAVYNCFFHDNRGGYGGGGIYIDSSDLVVQNSIIYNNTGVYRGGGFYADASTFFVNNCLVYNNKVTAPNSAGGGMFNNFSSPRLNNCTFAKNTAVFQGDGIINNAWSYPDINNCIFGENGDEIVNSSSSPNSALATSTVTNCIVTIKNTLIKDSGGSGAGWNEFYGIDGGNNIENNPLFQNFNGNDFRLTATSPAKDNGDAALLPSGISLDLAGNPRVIGTEIDMGALEFSGPVVCNVGAPCDDGDACTAGEVYQSNCLCAGGILIDIDNDNICDTDIADNCVGPNIGDTCNDGDPTTTNDIIRSDCTCLGNSNNNPGPCTTPSNIAIGKTATQSSTQFGALADRAIDGNTDGNFWVTNSTTLTNWEQQPWLEIDLGEIGDISSINIYGRSDCCTEFFANYYVFVSNTPFTSSNLNTTLNQSGVESFLETDQVGTPTTISVDGTGRYVRIQLQGQAFLGIAEVEIIGCLGGDTECPSAGTICNDNNPNTENDIEDGDCNCAGTPIACPPAGTVCSDNNPNTENDIEDGNCNCAGTLIVCPPAGTICNDNNPNTENDIEDGNCICAGTPIVTNGCTSSENIALGKTVAQSSTISVAGITGNPEKAIDGNLNGTFFISPASISSVTATNFGDENWWEIDLGDDYFIENISVFNRTDGVDRTRDAYILISQTPFTSDALADAREEADYEFFKSGLIGYPTTISPALSGRYVRVQRSNSGYLVLAEVVIVGCLNSTTNFATPNLVNFNVAKEGRQVNIDWVMQQDKLIDYYEIEKSINGFDFFSLKKMNADKSAEPRRYSTIDLQPEYGYNYYRLKVMNDDNTFYFTPKKKVNFDIDFSKVQLFPNPTDDYIHINLGDFVGKKGVVEIVDARGVLMQRKEFTSLPSLPATFDVSEFIGGMYMVSIKVEGHRRFTKRFIVSSL